MHPHHALKIIILSLLFAVAGCATSSTHQITPPKPKMDIKDDKPSKINKMEDAKKITLMLQDYKLGLKSIEVHTTKDTYNFLFDTGAGLAIIDPALTEEFGCKPAGELVGFRMSGEKLTFPRCENVSFHLGATTRNHAMIGIFDLSALTPPDWPKIHGMVSLASFEGSTLTLDLSHNTITVEDAGATPDDTMKAMKMQVGRQASGFSLDVFVGVDAPDGTLWFILDSGNAGLTTLSVGAARRLGIDLNADSVEHHKAGTKEEFWVVPGHTLNISGLGPYSSQILVNPHLIYDGNLNAAFLSQHVVTIDLKNFTIQGKRSADAPPLTPSHEPTMPPPGQ